MSKYNRFAKRLEEAFCEAREEYGKLYTGYTQAKRAYDTACQMWHETYVGEKGHKQAVTKAAYMDAKKALDNSCVWNNFDSVIKELTAEIKAEVNKNSVVTPENVDAAAVELLKSGAMGVSDYEAMRSKFDGNNTMLRLLSSYAQKAADAMPDDRFKERSELSAIAEATKNGDAAIINEWNNLVAMANTLSGCNDRHSHDYVMSMSEQFGLMGDCIENF